MTSYEDIIAALAEVRRRRGLSCAQLDEYLGFRPGTIARVESGRRGSQIHSPRLHILIPLAHALGVRIGFYRSTAKHPTQPVARQGFEVIDTQKNELRERASRGGRKRALMLSPKRRAEIARKAAMARWRPQSTTWFGIMTGIGLALEGGRATTFGL